MADTSQEHVYGAASFLRLVYSQGQIHYCFVTGKSRVRPLKKCCNCTKAVVDDDKTETRNFHKTIGLISKTKTLYVQRFYFCISLPFLHDYDVKMPNFAFYG